MLVNEYEVTEKRYIQWVYESKVEGKKLFFLIFWIVLTFVCLGAFAVYRQEYLLLVFAVYCLYRAVFRDLIGAKAFYKKASASHEDDKWIRTINITEDEIIVHDGKVEIKYKNSDIVKAVWNDERIRLFMLDNSSIRLYKDAFIEGELEDYLKILKHL